MTQNGYTSAANRIVELGKRVLVHGATRLANRRFGAVRRVITNHSVAAITFDDGPHPDITPRLLELLDKYGARATFFVVGRFAEEHPELILRATEAGHCVANHTFDHVSLPATPRSERRRQIVKCAEVLQPCESKLFRPPFGHQSIASQFDACSLGYEVVGWDVVGLDWLDRPAEFIADRLLTGIQKGSIILLHDRLFSAAKPDYFDRRPMMNGLEMLLERCADKFRFVTVPEMLSLGRPERANWYVKGDPEWVHSLQTETPEPQPHNV